MEDLNNTFDLLILEKNKEVDNLLLLKNKKVIKDKDKDSIDFLTKKTINKINDEIEKKLKASKSYKKTQLYNI